MAKFLLLMVGWLLAFDLAGQRFTVGMETLTGPAFTTFRGDLAQMVGFSELEITQAEVDTAFARFDLNAPRWLRDLFPGLRLEIDQQISRQVTRNLPSVRFFVRFQWVGGSLTISEPRLNPQLESKKWKNQWKAVRLSIAGNAEALAGHLARMAAADATQVKPFFSKRYDLEAHVHLSPFLWADRPLLEWGRGKQNTLSLELTTGIRFSADPSPVVDLGSVLFISEKLDSLLEGGLLTPVEKTTDQIAEAIQNVVFGRFRDPRIVPSFGWVARGEVPVNFGGGFSAVAGTEVSIQGHTSIKGTKPMFSLYGFVGMRWNAWGRVRKR